MNEIALLKNEVMPVEQGKLGLVVNSRLLWQRLKSGYRYADWVRERIDRYGFEDGVDFQKKLINSSIQGGRRAVDYVITLDMAKELAILEENQVGRMIRRYFIEIEKRYRDWIGFILPKLERDFDLFGQRDGYNYLQLLRACRCSDTSGAVSARMRKYPNEFWRSVDGVIFVSEKYGKTVITNAIARRLNAEAKEKRILELNIKSNESK